MIVDARIKRAWLVTDLFEMKTPKRERELVLLLKTGLLSEEALERELLSLEEIFRLLETPVMFCHTHELVTRYKVTQKNSSLTNVFYKRELKPFHFLICRN
jgi:hypothetical protein